MMKVDAEVLDLVSSSSSEEDVDEDVVSPSEPRASTVEASDEARSNASRGTTTVTVTASGRAGEGGGKDGDASVSTPVDAVAVRARVNAMTTRAGPSASATRHLEAFDDALEEDASNFKEARGRVGSTRYEALREWVTRDVEGYDEMRDEHKAMDARLRRAWNEFPEKRREAVLNREFEHLSAFLEELNRHGDFERARGARGTPRFDGIASCEAMNKSDLDASREELLAKFRTAKRDWQQKQRDDAKMRALRHLEDFAEEFKSTGDFESSRGPAESERRVALAALAKKKNAVARAAGVVGEYAEMLKTYENAQKSWTAKKKTMLTDGQATHLQDFITEYRAHGDFRRARGEVSTKRYATLSVVADKHAGKLCEPFQSQVITLQNAWRVYTEMKSKKAPKKRHVQAPLTNIFPQSVKATLPVSLAETKTADVAAASESEDARRDDENCSLSLEDQEDFYVDYKTNTIVQEVEEDKEEEEEEANNADVPPPVSTREDEDAKTDVPAPREPDAVHRSKVRRVSSPLDHLEDFYNEYKACKNFDLARGERGGERFKALARLNESNADDYQQPHGRRILRLQHMWTSIDYF